MKYLLSILILIVFENNSYAQLGFGFSYDHSIDGDEYGDYHVYTVGKVFKKGPAEKAGLKTGDKIIRINGTITESLNETAMANVFKNSPVQNVIIIRRNKKKDSVFITKADKSTYLNICLQGNCINGTGTFTDNDGSEYTGSFKNGKKEGKGKSVSANGYTYDGDWKDNKKEGWGKYSFKNTAFSFLYRDWTYEGQWKNDSMNGKGKFFFYDSSYYTGSVAANARSGYGKYVFKDSTTLEGEWKNNNMNGKGIKLLPNGDKLTGNFVNGKLEGEVIVYKKETNSTSTVIYKNDKVVPK